MLIYEAKDESGTEQLGAALAEALADGTVVALGGTLGAGKTRLVQAVAEASGVPRTDVTSPTFVLIAEYQGRRSIYHFDVHRLGSTDEFLALGPEEYFGGGGLTFVEWADRVASCLPDDRVEIAIEPTGATSRRFAIRATGPSAEANLARLAKKLG